ncbi:ATP-dependent helicase [Papillibacter cinnamivorans]|uniref:ATP-dependent DNA helicase PcrA n=1 Tax=Papillibacter cinnamivorans DSM 12816 TaxID=1122930 RepID=A0A1W1ZGC1_9FIRM|nr:UvrD-helicase domain-containing protein [Papillibacter cinnamivorans]SMC47595.1 DNA helicase-2 / ATP-dependent DNA helicase PcrA [Papillibacter cinnamivorans DSM 12816]
MTEQEFKKRYCKARREAIELEHMKLNPEQRRAVLATEGPLLLLAGAGSGKTTVLIHRIANLLRYGRGSDSEEVPPRATEADLKYLEDYVRKGKGEPDERILRLCAVESAPPWSIIAITFTNKAAGELKERLSRMLGASALDVWAFTFHAACARILRREIDRLGYSRDFTIYDTDDGERVMKAVVRDLNLDEKTFPPKQILAHVSRAKDRRLSPEEYREECEKSGDWRLIRFARAYGEYQKRLREANALDFDDIILHTVTLLSRFEEVRSYYQNKFRYVLIDEYQDTNHLQYLLASLLTGSRGNICVVGDDDQSIYRFRGATIENILSFEDQYPGARVIRLEQNYRSTGRILEAANAVIGHNLGRKGKKLWCDQGPGREVTVYTAASEHDEARYVAKQIIDGVARGENWRDHAILYRMNAQSRPMEYALKQNGIPYRIIGGTRFFDRAEIKDMLSYLCVINNPTDTLRLKRIINSPPRGIGARTLETAEAIALTLDIPLFQAAAQAGSYPELGKASARLEAFARTISELRELSETLPLPEFYDAVLERSGYLAALETKGDVESQGRAENVRELRSSIVNYLENDPEPSLGGFLNEIALYTDLDEMTDENSVLLMTMHSAKGLEFPNVYLVGAEEGVFPGMRSIGEPEEMEEERRLCYVAITRARERLFITCAVQRTLFGFTASNRRSRFVDEIPEALVLEEGYFPPKSDNPPPAAHTPGTPSAFSGTPRPVHSSAPTGRPKEKAAFRQAGAPASGLPDFRKGDMVRHKVFGQGMILTVQPMGGDALLEIAFDEKGTKRLMAKTAAPYLTKL